MISAVPDDIPATIPEEEPAVAIPGAPELQFPPEIVSDKVIVEPAHNAEAPAIPEGKAFTVTIAVERHPDPIE